MAVRVTILSYLILNSMIFKKNVYVMTLELLCVQHEVRTQSNLTKLIGARLEIIVTVCGTAELIVQYNVCCL